MRAMKDSGIAWIGEIPKSWKVVRIKYAIEQSADGIKIGPFGSALSNKTIADGKYNVYSQANLISCDFSKTKNTIAEETYESLIAYRVVPGDICVSMMGTIGKCKKVPQEICAGIMDSHLIKIRLSDNIVPEYFEYVYDKDLGGICFQQMMYLKKGTIMDGLNTSIVKQLFLPLPDIKTQHRIADYLDRKCSQIDAIIARQQEVIEKLKAYKLSVITEAVTKGLNPHAPMKDSGVEWIGEIPEQWSVVPLTKQLKSIVDYRGKTPEKVDTGVFLVTAKNIKNGKIDYEISTEYVKVEDYEEIMHRGIPQIGDVLFTTEAPLGQVANVDRTDIALAQRIIKFSTNEHLDSYYLKYWIMSIGFQNFLMALSTGSTALGIKASKLFMLPITLPSIKEQQQIVTYLDNKCVSTEAAIMKKSSLIDSLIAYKRSLIYEVVTGKKEV